jgi:hypothetical protein
MANTRTSERSKGTVDRVPFGGIRLKLQLSEADNKAFKARKKVPHWFNDDPGRLERALGGGYTFVKPEHATSLGQGALHQDGSDPESNARVSIVVNRSEPVTRAYLMEISEKFYKQDQAEKEKRNRLVDDALALGGKGASDVEESYRPK